MVFGLDFITRFDVRREIFNEAGLFYSHSLRPTAPIRSTFAGIGLSIGIEIGAICPKISKMNSRDLLVGMFMHTGVCVRVSEASVRPCLWSHPPGPYGLH